MGHHGVVSAVQLYLAVRALSGARIGDWSRVYFALSGAGSRRPDGILAGAGRAVRGSDSAPKPNKRGEESARWEEVSGSGLGAFASALAEDEWELARLLLAHGARTIAPTGAVGVVAGAVGFEVGRFGGMAGADEAPAKWKLTPEARALLGSCLRDTEAKYVPPLVVKGPRGSKQVALACECHGFVVRCTEAVYRTMGDEAGGEAPTLSCPSGGRMSHAIYLAQKAEED